MHDEHGRFLESRGQRGDGQLVRSPQNEADSDPGNTAGIFVQQL